MSICIWPNCRREFIPRGWGTDNRYRRREQQYCSKTCANRARAQERHHEAAAKWPTCAWEACGKRFQPSHPDQKCCSQPCAILRRVANNAAKDRPSRSQTPTLPAQHIPQCPKCHRRVSIRAFGSDIQGRSTVTCPDCGELPLPLIGRHLVPIHDQRERLEAELKARQTTAESPVDEKYKFLGGGSAYRQKAYKGIAAHLKPEAA